MRTIQNGLLALGVDSRGRIVSLRNKLTRTELVTHPEAAEAWRLVIPTARHSVDFICGSQQQPQSIEVLRGGG